MERERLTLLAALLLAGLCLGLRVDACLFPLFRNTCRSLVCEYGIPLSYLLSPAKYL